MNFVLSSTTFKKYIENGCPELKALKLDLSKLKCAYSVENITQDTKLTVDINPGYYYMLCTFTDDSSTLAQHNIFAFLGDSRVLWFAANGTEGKEAFVLQPVYIPETTDHNFRMEAPETFRIKKLEFYSTEE